MEPKTVNLVLIKDLFIRMRMAALQVHLIHLNTRNAGTHAALRTWYEEIIPLVDDVVEKAQGAQDGARIGYAEGPLPAYTETNPVALLKSVMDWLDANRAALTDRSELQALVDEIANLTHGVRFMVTLT